MNLESTVVALAACPSYEEWRLAEALEQTLGAIDMPGLASANILLKPNLISSKHGRLACTEGAFVLAVARWMQDHGARVSIGDSPSFGTTEMALQTVGIVKELADMGIPIKNFRRSRKTRLPGGGWAALAEDALDCDLLVNLPRVKAHAQTRLTLAVKNLFGCLSGMRKPWWHMIHGGSQGCFCDLLVRIPLALPPSATIVDGIVAMHCTGPVRGQPHPLGIMAASTNPVAIDATLHKILGVKPEHSPLMNACIRAGMNGTDLHQLSFPLAKPKDMLAAGFVVPDELHPIRFNPFRFLKSTMRRLLMERQAARQ